MPQKIDTVIARKALKVRREPHWHKIASDSYVGFRKMTDAQDGSWLARYWDEGTGKQLFESFGKLDRKPDHQRFDLACELARDWFSHLGAGGSTDRLTVQGACHNYAKHIHAAKSAKACADLEARYQRWIEKDPIAAIELTKLTREHVNAFRTRVSKTPVAIGKTGQVRARSKETVNRDITALRAALNHAKEDGHVTTDFAWQSPLKPTKNTGQRRSLYLSRDERRRLIAQAPPDLADFLQGLSTLPLRPGALAALTVASFNVPLQTLTIGTDKSGEDRKVKLPPTACEFFQQLIQDKLPAAPLFSRADGKPWNKDAWKDPIKEAAQKAGLPPVTVAYTLRHSVITDLVVDGLDLSTVAQISGTSVDMVQKHYAHLRDDVATAALAKLAL